MCDRAVRVARILEVFGHERLRERRQQLLDRHVRATVELRRDQTGLRLHVRRVVTPNFDDLLGLAVGGDDGVDEGDGPRRPAPEAGPGRDVRGREP